MAEYAYLLVDVFTEQQFGGNPLAVFPEAAGIAPELMQRIANELNLSETSFVLPAENGGDFRVRFFTPHMELPLAGHPTVGTADVLRREGIIKAPGRVIFEEGVGPISVTLAEDGVITMQQPVPRFGDVIADREAVAEMLSLSADDLHPDYPVQPVSSGVPFVYIPIRNLDAMARIKLRRDVWDRLLKDSDAPHVFTFTPQTQLPGSTVHCRMFAPAMGISEDPATGAASGPLGAYLVKYGLVPTEQAAAIVSEQGVMMGRPSLIHIQVQLDGDQITGVAIGGRSVYMGSGKLIIEG
jgi:trans-2,3-dihydro-3-hydroxyanthranilate isomerase